MKTASHTLTEIFPTWSDYCHVDFSGDCHLEMTIPVGRYAEKAKDMFIITPENEDLHRMLIGQGMGKNLDLSQNCCELYLSKLFFNSRIGSLYALESLMIVKGIAEIDTTCTSFLDLLSKAGSFVDRFHLIVSHSYSIRTIGNIDAKRIAE